MSHKLRVMMLTPWVVLILAWPAMARADLTSRPRHATHVVQPGETLSSIAAKHGVTLAALIQANRIANPDRIFVGTVLTIPEPTRAADSAAPLPSSGRCTSSYIVQPGETLYGIARRCSLSIQALASANGLSTRAIIYVGQRLAIPPQHGNETSRLATASIQPVATPAPPTGTQGCTDPYKVRRGDFLSSIARLCGVTVADLRRWNNLHSDIIYPGQWLRTRLSWSPITLWGTPIDFVSWMPELTPEPWLSGFHTATDHGGQMLPTPTPRIDPPLGD